MALLCCYVKVRGSHPAVTDKYLISFIRRGSIPDSGDFPDNLIDLLRNLEVEHNICPNISNIFGLETDLSYKVMKPSS